MFHDESDVVRVTILYAVLANIYRHKIKELNYQKIYRWLRSLSESSDLLPVNVSEA